MTFDLSFKGNLHDFLPESAEIYETVLFKKMSSRFTSSPVIVSNFQASLEKVNFHP